MLAAFDFGISNTDVAIFSKNSVQFFTTPSSSQNITTDLIKKILSKLDIPISKVEAFGVTGGKSSDLDDSLMTKKIIKVNEIDAIGLGAKKLYEFGDEPTLVVSAGTGTACVHIDNNNFNHLGGIAVGGGMLEGLGHLLFENGSGHEINEFGEKGLRNHLDLLIGDAVNKIGNLSPDLTAVNFGKAKFSNADTIENTSASLCNCIGEVIGTIAYLNALLIGSKKAYFIGRTSLLSLVINGINERLKLAGVSGVYGENREYANVIGVLERIKDLA